MRESYKTSQGKYELHQEAVTLTITEGKYHEIKFMFQALGDKVTYLKRLRYEKPGLR